MSSSVSGWLINKLSDALEIWLMWLWLLKMPTSVADVDWVRRAFGNISDLSYKGMKDMLLFQEDLANIELKEISS